MSRPSIRSFLAALLALAIVLASAPVALAEDLPAEPPAPVRIVAGVTICGVDVGGMTAEEASSALAAGWTAPTLAPITVDATGSLFVFDPTPAVSLDRDALLADALATAEPVALAPRYLVDDAALSRFVAGIEASVAVAPVNATRTLVSHRLVITPAKPGRALDATATLAALAATLDAELAAGGAEQPFISAPVLVVLPRVTAANIGKTILVVLHERYLYFYDGAKLVKKYRCAIGMRRYPTPTGKFKVIGKRVLPSWTNPGSAWARTMPRYIRPGFYNPLGLRALYINSSGIRIHGTSKWWSMGQAASHGCVRLTNKMVVELYPKIPVGTPVWIVK